jgi:hypothetical protein
MIGPITPEMGVSLPGVDSGLGESRLLPLGEQEPEPDSRTKLLAALQILLEAFLVLHSDFCDMGLLNDRNSFSTEAVEWKFKLDVQLLVALEIINFCSLTQKMIRPHHAINTHGHAGIDNSATVEWARGSRKFGSVVVQGLSTMSGHSSCLFKSRLGRVAVLFSTFA